MTAFRSILITAYLFTISACSLNTTNEQYPPITELKIKNIANKTNLPDFNLGVFDEENMAFLLLNESTGETKKIIHIEDQQSGFFRRTVWRPDGQQIAFTGKINGKTGTYKINPDGSGLELIIEPEGDTPEGVLDWHPKQGLIFVLKNIDNNAEIYSVRSADDLTNLTKNKAWDFFPDVLSDGRIMFFSNRDEGQASPPTFKNSYIMNADGSNVQPFVIVEGMSLTSLSATGIFPDVAKDIETVTVTLNEDIYVIDIMSGKMTNLTNTPKVAEMTPSFSFDNQFVIYSAMDKGDGNNLGKSKCVMNLYKINLKTREKTQVTHGNNCFSHPLYRPLH